MEAYGMQLNRRTFLSLGAAAAAIPSVGLGQSALRPLPIIAMRDYLSGIIGRIDLNLNSGTHDFGTGAASKTYGISNSYLGPILRVKKGQVLPFDIQNNLSEVTTLHWHGLHIPGNVDGGPHQEIAPGHSWSPDVPISQRASMNWFHSHTHGKTARQTYLGLAGVLLVEDDDSLSADLPQTYGVDDFTVVLQDKAFDAAGRLSYSLTGETFENGFMGEQMIVNGVVAPVGQTVPKGLVRLRILNACNARFLTLSLTKGPLTVIASDGGFLASAVETPSLIMSPGERYEVLVDMAAVQDNALMVAFNDDEDDAFGWVSGLFGAGAKQTALQLTQDPTRKGFDGAVPKTLANLPAAQRSQASRTRRFVLNMGDDEEQLSALAAAWGNFCGEGAMGINGRPMKMDHINETVKRGDTEIWKISTGEQLHPFHIHGCSFRILSQNGTPPPAYAAGWKDMVHVEEEWSEVLVRFDHAAPADAPYMYHCHILEHEDCGMMGQFTVS
jgi:blue copper oxidase